MKKIKGSTRDGDGLTHTEVDTCYKVFLTVNALIFVRRRKNQDPKSFNGTRPTEAIKNGGPFLAAKEYTEFNQFMHLVNSLPLRMTRSITVVSLRSTTKETPLLGESKDTSLNDPYSINLDYLHQLKYQNEG